ncbi:MAG: hypothetical protein NC489_47360 [Ruminococcus flavefaciens]|nr:hypothetical protein [Ruminococcus flavefaciens]
MARPQKNIDKALFENACELQCTLQEIAHLFDCSADTVERWCKREYEMSFADIYKKKAENGKMSLRRNQLKLSETSATMAIWLGKQWLGQKDASTVDANVKVTNPMEGLTDKELRALANNESTTKTDSG